MIVPRHPRTSTGRRKKGISREGPCNKRIDGSPTIKNPQVFLAVDTAKTQGFRDIPAFLSYIYPLVLLFFINIFGREGCIIDRAVS